MLTRRFVAKIAPWNERMPLAARLLLLLIPVIVGPPLLAGLDFVLWAGLSPLRLAALAGSLIPGIALVWYLALRVAAPWLRLSEATQSWSEGNWQARIEPGDAPEEFRRVAARLNVLAER